jgi:hypothetical protein
MRNPTAVLIIAASIVLAGRRAADACSYPPPLFEREIVPADGDFDVPLNAQIRVYYSLNRNEKPPERGMVAIRPVGGDPIAVTTSAIENPQYLGLVTIVRPDAPLVGGTTYEILDTTIVPCEQPWDGCVLADPVVIATFSTGFTEDIIPPVYGGLAGFSASWDECDDDACCGPYAGFHVSFLEDPTPPSDSGRPYIAWNVYRVGQSEPVMYAGLHGVAGWRSCDAGPFFFEGIRVQNGQSYMVRAVDLAGHEDTNTSVHTIDISCADRPPPPDGGGGGGGGQDDAGPDVDANPGADPSDKASGCRVSSPGSDSAVGAVLLLLPAAVLLARRRRRAAA